MLHAIFLPYRPVIKESSTTTKVRIVYDGSAKRTPKDLSLNDCLHDGPNLLPLVFDLLIQFRLHPYVILTDLAKAFLQIELHEQYTNYLKFFWKADINDSNVSVYKFCRVMFGLKPSPFILNAVLRIHFDTFLQHSPYLDRIKSSFYVDDMVCGCDTEEQAIEIATIVNDCLANASFQCHKWQSNSLEVKRNLISKNFNCSQEQAQSVLGLSWNSSSDTFKPVWKDISLEKPTKRMLLSFAASVYDPLGLFSCILINLKLLLQEAHKLKIGWDENLPNDLILAWKNVSIVLQSYKSIHIPRYIPIHSKIFEIHGFCDASTKAIAACIYLRLIHQNNTYSVQLLCSKTNLAPIKQLSIPRLELIGCLLLSRLIHSVSKFCQNIPIILWLDS